MKDSHNEALRREFVDFLYHFKYCYVLARSHKGKQCYRKVCIFGFRLVPLSSNLQIDGIYKQRRKSTQTCIHGTVVQPLKHSGYCMSWLRHYATSWKVADSSPDEVGCFNIPNPYSRTMSLDSTQPLTEMSTRKPIVSKMWEPRRLTTL
jgi:hypothetical protein